MIKSDRTAPVSVITATGVVKIWGGFGFHTHLLYLDFSFNLIHIDKVELACFNTFGFLIHKTLKL